MARAEAGRRMPSPVSTGYRAWVRSLHVTSSRNRASIEQYGLDWDRMGASAGIAGSRTPEVAGVYLCENESEADWFVRMNNTCGPVDVWIVEGVGVDSLIDNGSGHSYVRERIPADRLTLLRCDLQQVARPE